MKPYLWIYSPLDLLLAVNLWKCGRLLHESLTAQRFASQARAPWRRHYISRCHSTLIRQPHHLNKKKKNLQEFLIHFHITTLPGLYTHCRGSGNAQFLSSAIPSCAVRAGLWDISVYLFIYLFVQKGRKKKQPFFVSPFSRYYIRKIYK